MRKKDVTFSIHRDAREAMKAAGWEHTRSVSVPADRRPGDGPEAFGSLWEKDGRAFWLSHRTMDRLPLA